MRLCFSVFLLAVLPAWIPAAANVPPTTSLNPSDNAALYYFRAFDVRDGIDAINKSAQLADHVWDLPLDKTTQQNLRACRPVLQLLHLGSQMPYCNWGHRVPVSEWGSVALPELSSSRSIAGVALLDVRLLWSQQHFEKAAQRVQDVFILAHRIGKDGTLMGALVGSSIYSGAIQMIASHIATLPKAALSAMQAALIQTPTPNFLVHAMLVNYRHRLDHLHQMTLAGQSRRLQSFWRVVWIWEINNKAGKPPTAKNPPVPPMPVDFRRQLQAAIPEMERCKERIAAIRRQVVPQLLDTLKKIRDQDGEFRRSRNVVLRFESISHSASILGLNYRSIIHMSALRAAIAYRLGGRPAFNKIKDPFGPGPFTLKWQPDQLLICSHFGDAVLKDIPPKFKSGSELIIPLHLPHR